MIMRVNAVGAVGSIGVNVFQISRNAGRSFDIRMAAVNGGGLVLGGPWMRRS
jgi:hypothetical protein